MNFDDQGRDTGAERKNGRMLTVIHTGDLHLGAEPDAGMPWAKARREELWESFRRLVAAVREEQAEVLVIAGDLFHRQPLVRELQEVNALFGSIPRTRVVLIAGNHDFIGRDSAYVRFPWKDNVIGLWEERLQRVSVPELGLAVCGCSYHRREIRENLCAGARPEGREPFQLLVAHGGDRTHSPLDVTELRAAGFSYVALGHIHKPGILVENRIAYCGAPEPIDRNETGAHGYLRVRLSETGGSQVTFVPFAGRSYRWMDVTVTPEMTQFELELEAERLRAALPGEDLIRLRLRGNREAGRSYQTERLMRLGHVVDVTDETRPYCDLPALLHRYRGTVAEAFLRELMQRDDALGKRALDYGLEALLEAEETR